MRRLSADRVKIKLVKAGSAASDVLVGHAVYLQTTRGYLARTASGTSGWECASGDDCSTPR
jgi:hypothetical protein